VGVVGADLDQLRTLANTLTQAADRLENASVQTTAGLASVRWMGPDAERHRNQWQGESVPHIRSAADALRSAAAAVRRNADEQQTASAAGLSGIGFPSGTYSPDPNGPNMFGIYRDFTGAAPLWPINNDTLLSAALAGTPLGRVLPAVDGAAIAFDDRLTTDQKIGEGTHLAYDTFAGSLRASAISHGDYTTYLSGVAMSQWGDVVDAASKADFSSGTRALVGNYIVSDPGGAFDAAASAVHDYIPKMVSNWTWW
jgi:hypothetical protein